MKRMLSVCLLTLMSVSAFAQSASKVGAGMGANYHTAQDEQELRLVEESCVDYYRTVISLIRQNGGAPFIWDNGQTMRRGRECFGLFDRRDGMKCMHPLVLEAVRQSR